jgi:hypothetical protein
MIMLLQGRKKKIKSKFRFYSIAKLLQIGLVINSIIDINSI